MSQDPVVLRSLASDLVNQVAALAQRSGEENRPLEIDPYREELFGLFAQAWKLGLTGEEAEPDLSADGLCHELSSRWGLADATRQSVEQQTRLPPEQLGKLRLVWSVMRMWMEWTYAWERWDDFHGG